VKVIAITGSSGQIGYILSFLVAKGEIFGPQEPICLRLLVKRENLSKARGVQMELEDCCLPALQSVLCTPDCEEAFNQADIVFFAGAKVNLDPSKRKANCEENWTRLAEQAEVLNRSGSPHTNSIVIANPCNTNAYLLSKMAPRIYPDRFHALSKLDELRASYFLGRKTFVFGNHSPSIAVEGGLDVNEFTQKRGAEVTQMRGGVSSGFSACWAAILTAKALFHEGEIFCSGVYSRGNPFGIDEDLFYSFPCRSLGNGRYEIVKDVQISESLKQRMHITEKELIQEREMIRIFFSKNKQIIAPASIP